MLSETRELSMDAKDPASHTVKQLKYELPEILSLIDTHCLFFCRGNIGGAYSTFKLKAAITFPLSSPSTALHTSHPPSDRRA